MNDRIVILIIDDIEVNRVILKGIFEDVYKRQDRYNVIGSSRKSRYVDKKISSGKNYKYIVKSINVVSKAKYSSCLLYTSRCL